MPENLWPQYADKLAGGWKCISYEVFDGSGQDKKLIDKPHGETPLGRAIMTRGGFLSAHMSKPDRVNKPLPSGKPWVQGNDDEVAYVAKGHSMYCGHLELYKLENGQLQWKTRVVISSDPARMGGLEVRNVNFFEENGKEYMILQPENDMILEDGTRTRGVLKWEKFE